MHVMLVPIRHVIAVLPTQIWTGLVILFWFSWTIKRIQ